MISHTKTENHLSPLSSLLCCLFSFFPVITERIGSASSSFPGLNNSGSDHGEEDAGVWVSFNRPGFVPRIRGGGSGKER